MSEKRFEMRTTIIDPFPIWDTVEEKGYNCTDTLDLLVELLNKLYEENEQLREILKDIVVATDETYTKNTSMFKVTVVLDYEKYREIRRCIE